MTFQEHEESVEGGRPIELYHFSIGLEDYYYTSAEDTVVFGGNSYVSRQIKRNSPDQSTEEGRSKLELTMLSDDPLCSRYIGVAPPTPMYVTVTKFHRSDLTDGRVLWSGRIIMATYLNSAALCKLTAVASESVLSRQIPHFKYQGLCNHFLYDDNCTISPLLYRYVGVATDIAGELVTVAGLQADKGAGWAVGGKIVIGVDVRPVLAQSGDVLTLSMPFASDPTGQTAEVYAGCDHTLATCNSKFANAINYGGFAFVPTKNPFQTGIG